MRRQLLASPLFVLLLGCGETSSRTAELANEAVLCPALKKYSPARAASDAKQHLRRGEHFLLGIYGYATDVPGQAAGLSVRFIRESSDYECPRLNALTREYARRFNRVMSSSQ